MFKYLALFCLILTCVYSKENEDRENQEAKLWKDTLIRPEFVDEMFFDENFCTQRFEAYVSCVFGLNKISFLKNKQFILPVGDTLEFDEYFDARVKDGYLYLDLKKSKEHSFEESKKTVYEIYRKVLNYIVMNLKIPEGSLDYDFDTLKSKTLGVLNDELEEDLSILADGMSATLAVAFYDHSGVGLKNTFSEMQKDSHENVGLGVLIQKTLEGPTIVKVFEDGGAANAGIKKGDVITAIDGKSIALKNLEDTLNELKGEIDTKVEITISRLYRTRNITVTRTKYSIKNINVEIKKHNNSNIAYAKIHSFMSPKTCDILDDELSSKIGRKRVKSIILDLRGNGGGLFDQAICIADLFLGAGLPAVIVQELPGTQDSRVSKSYTFSKAKFKQKLVILVDSLSASASELLTLALAKNNKKVIVVGEKTFGKGTVQSVLSLKLDPENVYMKLNTAVFYGPDGMSHQLVGITPHFTINNPHDDEVEFREVDYSLNPIPSRNEEISFKVPIRDRKCAHKSRHLYPSTSPQQYTKDHQLLFSLDLLSCLENKKF